MHSMLWVLSIYILVVFILIFVFLMIISHQKEEKAKSLMKQQLHEIEQTGPETGNVEAVTKVETQAVANSADADETVVTGDINYIEEPTGDYNENDEYSEYQE